VVQENISQADAGKTIFGASHTSVAAYLFSLWGLASPMVEAVALHQKPGESETRSFSPLTAVHVAHVFSAELVSDPTPGTHAELDLGYLKAVGVDSEIEEWRREVKEMLANG